MRPVTQIPYSHVFMFHRLIVLFKVPFQQICPQIYKSSLLAHVLIALKMFVMFIYLFFYIMCLKASFCLHALCFSKLSTLNCLVVEICNANKTGLPCLLLKILVWRKTDDAQNMKSITVSEYVLLLSSDSHSTIPMLDDWSQYGISVLMTDERASQVSHSS